MKTNIIYLVLFLFKIVCANIILLNSSDIHIDKPAAFGPSIAKEGIRGNLSTLPVDSLYGCHSITVCPTTHWIALVERGNCSFVDKVRALQQSGAIAVVIGDRYSNSWVTMYPSGDASDITIPSVYVAQYQYLSLLQHLAYKKDRSILVLLTQEENFSWTKSDISLLLMTCLGILYALYLTWRLPHRQRHMDYDHEESAPVEIIHSLPTRVFHKEKTDEVDECIICLEEYQETEIIRILPCKHEFHLKCIDPWLIHRKRFVSI
ncbi:hypothetical protein BDB01DRAFT_846068 [Pilobolus umbonatus]|nr:hypothetical protein BDB01DRAFT_846068 [Pilobolus umbonatus]